MARQEVGCDQLRAKGGFEAVSASACLQLVFRNEDRKTAGRGPRAHFSWQAQYFVDRDEKVTET